jgi:type IV pilus assembly protein PilQ
MKLRPFVLSSLAAIGIEAALTAAESRPDPNVQQLISVETTDKPLETVLQWISRRAEVTIVCNEVEQPRITIRLPNVTWQEAVAQIADRYDLVIEKKSERLWQLTRPPKVRMEFQDARLTVVLEALARQANVNIVISDDVNSNKRLTMTLNGVPWREALDVIVKATGYTWIEQNYHIIRVVSKENVQKDLQTRVFHLNYTNGASIKDSIAVAMSTDGKLVHDARTNSLVLTDTPLNLDAATAILNQLDMRTREVLIEMKFVDFSVTDVKRMGFDPLSLGVDVEDFGRVVGQFTPFAATPSANVGGYRTGLGGVVDPFAGPGSIPTYTGNVSGAVTFEAIATLLSTEIIQTPQILTLDNTKASIFIGHELHYAEETVTVESGISKTTLKEAQSSPVKDGITIEVTPHITSDGYVSLELIAKDENVTLREYTSGLSKISLPDLASTNISTSIMVADSQTAVIGGILKNKAIESEAHIPGLAKIPVLGYLFKKESNTVEQRNLTLFITPRIISNRDMDIREEEAMRLREKISGLPQKAPAAAEQTRSLDDAAPKADK